MSEELEVAATVMSDSTVAAGPAPEGSPDEANYSKTGPRSVLPRIEHSDGAVHLILEPRERYRLMKLLGAGGMGKVELAEDQDIGRSVAIKHLLTKESLARFIQEVRTIGRLEHPNIVPIHDVGVDENGHFFVMKFVEGETLREIIAKLDAGDPGYHRRFTFERRVQAFIGVLRALQFAHSRGVIHRDIKPENVMIGRFGEVMLMDWGVAKTIGEPSTTTKSPCPETARPAPTASAGAAGPLSSTRAGDLLGTPAYMSPEQARGEHDKLDARSDLYSATALLYELLFLRHYLAGRVRLIDILAGVIEEPIRMGRLFVTSHPHQSLPPAALVHFVRRGLQKDPAKRFQSAEEMIEQLQRIGEGHMAVQCAFTLVKRGVSEIGRFADRHPLFLLLLLAATLGLLGFGAVQLIRLLLS